MATSAGSLALAQHRARSDAEIVARLRAAGAVLLGKTNLSEWANFRSTDSTSGWSSLGGQTRNPYVLDRNPCGSSSGSAVAVAARLAPLAVGTETDGSIVCPAAANGVVGIKPTIGTVESTRHRADRTQPGHGGPDGAHCRRCGTAAVGARGAPVRPRPHRSRRRNRGPANRRRARFLGRRARRGRRARLRDGDRLARARRCRARRSR